LWHTYAGEFGHNSQNYSQIALANLISLDLLIDRHWVLMAEEKNP
jgi:hypothetical protein